MHILFTRIYGVIGDSTTIIIEHAFSLPPVKMFVCRLIVAQLCMDLIKGVRVGVRKYIHVHVYIH